jgi:hypothetical protein
MAAIDLAAGDGVVLDPTYTAKAFAALLDRERQGGPHRRWLYWHTLDSRTTASPVSPAPRQGPFPDVLRALLDRSK